jgi:cyclopropane fatty-acyl-phospholipid synthase-like methyltransferase
MTSGSGLKFSVKSIRGTDRGYTAYHAPRFAHVLDTLAHHGVGARSKVLDIGRSRLTELMHEQFGCQVDSLGFGGDSPTPEGRHFEFDLNRSQRPEDWRTDLPRYDVIVMAEVIEHLYTAPQLVLRFIRTLLVPGGLLLVQTPNAADLSRRIKLVLGRNPYEMIRTDVTNPGHFREYTRAELRALAEATGFHVQRMRTRFYFDMRYAIHGDSGNHPRPVRGTIKNLIYASLPAPLRWGITAELRATGGGADARG